MKIRRMLSVAVLWTAARGATSAHAQTIVGTVVDQTSRPVAGVLVLMLDSASNVSGRALTTDRGTFRVASPRAGTYRVRTMRIGFRPTTSDPIVLLAGGEVERRLVLTGAAMALDTMRVVDRRSCRITSDSAAAATFAVWEQARTALTATQLTTAGRSAQATIVSYDRTLSADGRQTLKQTSNTRTETVTQPWRTVSPDSVHRAGYIVTDRQGFLNYHAPSIEVLLSNVFLDDHCFRLTTDRKRAEQVGIAFEPSSDRKQLAELKGTLWLDRKTAELRQLEYKYTNISAEQELAGAGGDVEFGRLLNGGWAITRWNIRMPVLEQTVRTQSMGGIQVHVAEIQVTGGEMTLVSVAAPTGRDTVWVQGSMVAMAARHDSLANALKIAEPVAAASAAFRGVVVDSVDAPLSGAEIALPDLTKAFTSDAKGAFQFADIPAGDQHVIVRRVGYSPLDVTVPFVAGATVERKLVLHRTVSLDSVVVKAARIDPAMQSFEDHRKVGLGHFYTRDDLEKVRYQHLSTVIAQTPGMGMVHSRGGEYVVGKRAAPTMCKQFSYDPSKETPMQRAADMLVKCYESAGYYVKDVGDPGDLPIVACYAHVYLNGKRINPGQPTPYVNIDTFQPDQIEGIEYYASVSQVPMEYASSDPKCGVVVIHSRRSDTPRPSAAPTTGSFTGVVVDSLAQPLAGAEVSLPDLTRPAISDAKGAFSLGDVPFGDRHVVVHRVGYAPIDTTLSFLGAKVERKFVLHRVRTLDSVAVNARAADPRLADFEYNRRLGLGHFLTRDQLAKMETMPLGEVIGGLPGAKLMRGVNTRGWIYSSRGVRCAYYCDDMYYHPDVIEARQGMTPACFALVYLDDIMVTAGHPTVPFDVSSIPVERVEAIEYYGGPATTPAKYTSKDTQCGVVVIHTRKDK